jgi:hypothetical protein
LGGVSIFFFYDKRGFALWDSGCYGAGQMSPIRVLIPT